MSKFNKYYKISLISLAVAAVAVLVEVVFVIMPIYGLVGSSQESDNGTIDATLQRTQALVYVFGALISLSIVVGVTSLILGIIKNAKDSKH